MGTNYQAGRRLEWQIRAEYQKDGYIVARTAGSKSPVDLVAWNDKEIIFIQCKYGSKPTIPKKSPVPIGKLNAWFALLWKPRGGEASILRTFSQANP